MMKIPNFIATKLHFILHLYILFFNGLYCLSKFAVVVVCAAEFVVWPWVRQVRWQQQKISAILKISAIPKINMMLKFRVILKILKLHKYLFMAITLDSVKNQCNTEIARTFIIWIFKKNSLPKNIYKNNNVWYLDIVNTTY